MARLAHGPAGPAYGVLYSDRSATGPDCRQGVEGEVVLTSRPKLTMCLVSLGLASGTLLVPASTALAAPADTHFVVVNDPQTFTATAFCLPEDKLGTVVTQETSSGNERRDKQWRRRGDRC